MTVSPAEKLKLAKQITSFLDEALEGKDGAAEQGVEILLLAARARLSQEHLVRRLVGAC